MENLTLSTPFTKDLKDMFLFAAKRLIKAGFASAYKFDRSTGCYTLTFTEEGLCLKGYLTAVGKMGQSSHMVDAKAYSDSVMVLITVVVLPEMLAALESMRGFPSLAAGAKGGAAMKLKFAPRSHSAPSRR